jgi:hypothetical protein
MSTQSEASVESSAMSSGPSERRLCRRHGGGVSGGSSETPPKWTSFAVVAALLLGGCAARPQVVPVAATGIAVEPGQSAITSPDAVQLVVQPSAWRGSPSYLPTYVTPFQVLLVNGSSLPIRYDYGDFRLYDEARFQYTAMPPADVALIFRWSEEWPSGALVASAGTGTAFHRRPGPLFWDPWWDPWWWGPRYYPPRLDDVLTQALPVGALHPGARSEGFVYFPRLRRDASRLTFEFHYRLGDAERTLALPFAVQRAGATPALPAAAP